MARIKTTCGGGSSNVFRRALNAAVDSIWHSSITYTFHLVCNGANLERSIRSLMLSTPVFEAASISITSKAVPELILLQLSHSPHGSIVGPVLSRQFNDFARILALDVFPVPLGPLNRYAGAILRVIKACLSVVAIAS